MNLMQRTLLVGLGGAGAATLRNIRRQLTTYYGGYDIPALEYLVIDTDPDGGVKHYTHGGENVDDVAFRISRQVDGPDANEKVSISVSQRRMQRFYDGLMDSRLQEATAWFDQSFRDFGTSALVTGAAGRRAAGRLAFLMGLIDRDMDANSAPLVDTLMAKLRRLARLTPKDQRWDKYRGKFGLDESKPSINVFVVASVAGGTGAGIFLDFGYYLSWLVAEHRQGSERSANPFGGFDVSIDPVFKDLYLILPDVFLGDDLLRGKLSATHAGGQTSPEQMQAGAYAALAELDRYYTRASSEFSFAGGASSSELFVPPWDPTILGPGGQRIPNPMLDGTLPYEWVTLISNQNGHDRMLKNRNDAVRMVANHLMVILTSKNQRELMSSIVSNRSKYKQPQLVEGRWVGRAYGSIGHARLSAGAAQFGRWGALYLAERLVERLRQPSPLQPGTISARTEKLLSDHGWTGKRLYIKFSKDALEGIYSKFRGAPSLENMASEAKETAQARANEARLLAFGHLDKIDNAYEAFVATAGSTTSLEDIAEEVIREFGIEAAVEVLNNTARRLAAEKEALDADLATERNSFDQFSAQQSLEWLVEQSANLEWLGSSNKPTDVARLRNFFSPTSSALKDLEHLEEVKDLEPVWLRPVAYQAMRGRLARHTFAEGTRSAWFASLFPDSFENFMRNGRLEGQIAMLRSTYADLHRALARTHQEVLTRVAKGLDLALQRVRGLIARLKAKDYNQALDQLLERQTSEGNQGILPRLKQAKAEEGRDQNRPDIIRGAQFREAENLAVLAVKDKDGKDAFPHEKLLGLLLENLPDGKRRLWDIAELLKADLEEVLDHLEAAIERERLVDPKPDLEISFDTLYSGAKGAPSFEDDLHHISEMSHPFLRITFPLAGQVPIELGGEDSSLFVPDQLSANLKQKVETKLLLSAKGSSETGDIILIRIQDGLPLQYLSELSALEDHYRRFPHEGSLRTWTQDQGFKELTASVSGRDSVRLAVVEGLLLGTITFSTTEHQFYCSMEQIGALVGAMPTPVGTTVAAVIEFFASRSSALSYRDPLARLESLNGQELRKRPTLCKLLPLLNYYQNWIFKDPKNPKARPPADNRLIEKIIHRVQAELSNQGIDAESLGQDQKELSQWLHQFCTVVPLVKDSRHEKPDAFWVPVLAQKRDRATILKALEWHNQSLVKKGFVTAQQAHLPTLGPAYAMTAFPPVETLSALLSDGVRPPADPTEAPANVLALAWNTASAANAPARAE